MLLYCIIVFKFNSTFKWFFQMSKQVGIAWCQIMGCTSDVSEPLNPSRQFSVWFDESYEGTHDPAERLHLVEADQLCWNPSGRHFTEFKMFANNFLGRNDTQAQFSCRRSCNSLWVTGLDTALEKYIYTCCVDRWRRVLLHASWTSRCCRLNCSC